MAFYTRLAFRIAVFFHEMTIHTLGFFQGRMEQVRRVQFFQPAAGMRTGEDLDPDIFTGPDRISVKRADFDFVYSISEFDINVKDRILDCGIVDLHGVDSYLYTGGIRLPDQIKVVIGGAEVLRGCHHRNRSTPAVMCHDNNHDNC